MIAQIQTQIATYTDYSNAEIEKFEAQIRKQKRYQEWLSKHEAYIQSILPTIEEGLKAINYKINAMSLDSAHIKDHLDYLNEFPSIHLRVELTAIGRRSPLKREFRSDMMSRAEYKRIDESIRKTEVTFKEITNYRLDLNQYTMHKPQTMALIHVDMFAC